MSNELVDYYGEAAGQKVDLTVRIREILRIYPEGGSILKELLQNSDDAGAKICRICYDKRTHPSEKLWNSKMSSFQGPALYIYNDALFTEADFKSIQQVGDSLKKDVLAKTGRFGVGFNSVYHLTDLPGFVSGNYIMIFDPHCHYLPNANVVNPGTKIDFVKYNVLKQFPDQYEPWKAFGCDVRTPFKGTLFRLPLRNESQAKNSKISKESYNDESILSLFTEFEKESRLILLFLKNIERIELSIWEPNDSQPTIHFSTEISNINSTIRKQRSYIQELLKKATTPSKFPFHKDILVLEIDSINPLKNTSQTQSWVVSHILSAERKPMASFLQSKEVLKSGLKIVPWAGVAYPLSLPTKNEGRAFCFLPLPTKTGLPIEINGYFELSQNRRDVWQGDDVIGAAKMRVLWNELILSELVSEIWLDLALWIGKKYDFSDPFYNLFPQDEGREIWKSAVKGFYDGALKKELFISNGNLRLLENSLFLNEKDSTEKFREVLLEEDVPIVHLPNNILRLLKLFGGVINYLTPKVLHSYLIKPGKHPSFHKLDSAEIILDFFLSDMTDKEYHLLVGLKLLPLCNDKIEMFNKPNVKVYWLVVDEKEKSLFQSMSDRCINSRASIKILNKPQIMESTNIRAPNRQDLLMLLDSLFPVSIRIVPLAKWDKSVISVDWLKNFWEYCYKKKYPLSLLEYPLLVARDNNQIRYLCSLNKNSFILSDVKNIGEDILNIIGKLGVVIIEDELIPPNYPDISPYLRESTLQGVLLSIYSSCGDNMSTFQNLTLSEKRTLRSFFSRDFGITPERNAMIQTLMKFPIFEVYGEVATVPLSSENIIPPPNVEIRLLSSQFVRECTVTDSTLYRLLPLPTLSLSEFYKKFYFDIINELDSKLRDATALNILSQLGQLESTLASQLNHYKWIPTATGDLSAPKDMYDPRVQEFHQLFDQMNFPSSTFQESVTLNSLQSLGMKSELRLPVLLESARNLSNLTSEEVKISKSGALMKYMEKYLEKIAASRSTAGKIVGIWKVVTKGEITETEEEVKYFEREIIKVNWLTVKIFNSPLLPMNNDSSVLGSPENTRPEEDQYFVSFSKRIFDGKLQSPELKRIFGWSKPISVLDLSVQLQQLSRTCSNISKDKGNEQKLASIIPQIYEKLEQSLKDTPDIKPILYNLRDEACIWVGGEFVKANMVAFENTRTMRPYLYSVPDDLKCFKKLFTLLNVKEKFSTQDYLSVLLKLQDEYPDKPLPRVHLELVVSILQYFFEKKVQLDNIILVPDEKGILHLATHLTYHDAPWIQYQMLQDNEQKFIFVHNTISNKVAEFFKVKSFRSTLLLTQSLSLELRSENITGLEAFGQKESLISRLKHILDMYAEGRGVFNELLQNADDAGASSWSLIWDKRTHASNSLLSPDMKEWQGTAFMVYNDGIFLEKDYKNIVNIGQGSKLEDLSTTGRFGLGFNSVYHFTDIPSFVSHDTIVIFDPHILYLPYKTPGIRINFTSSNLAVQFPDQFIPYQMFGCNMKDRFKGTLFRLPLRSIETAKKSKLKNTVYTNEKIMELLKTFQSHMDNVIIFLKNICKVTISIIHENGVREDLYSSERKIHKNEEWEEIHNFMKVYDREKFYERLNSTKLPSVATKVIVSTSTPSEKKEDTWLVTAGLVGGVATEKTLSLVNKNLKLVPYGGVASKLSGDKESGSVFCFLPIPVCQSGLPVLINGYFELSSDRRDIWRGKDMTGDGNIRAKWNEILIESVISTLYSQLILEATKEISWGEKFFQLFPVLNGTFEPFSLCINPIYKELRKLPVCFCEEIGGKGKWKNIEQVFVVPKNISSKAINVLLNEGLLVTQLPTALLNHFAETGSISYITPEVVKGRISVSKRYLSDQTRETGLLLLEYFLDNLPEGQYDKLCGLQLIPLSDGSFSTFNKSAGPVFVIDSKYHNLSFQVKDKVIDVNIPGTILEKLKRNEISLQTNITSLTKQSLNSFLKLILPEVLQKERGVKWISQPDQESSIISWNNLESLWSLISGILSDFDIIKDWNLIPTMEGMLVQISNVESLIERTDFLPEKMRHILAKIGVKTLNSRIKLPQMNGIQPPNTKGILKAIMYIAGKSSQMNALFQSVSKEERQEFRSFLCQFSWSEAEEDYLIIIRSLPIFELHYNFMDLQTVPEYTHITDQLLPSTNVDPMFLSSQFLKSSLEGDYEFYKTLGVPQLSTGDIYLKFTMPHIEKIASYQQAVFFFNHLMKDFKRVCEEVPEFPKLSGKIKCFPNNQQTLEKITNLYDPTNMDLQDIFTQDYFLDTKLSEPQGFLEYFKVLGLLTVLNLSRLSVAVKSISNEKDMLAATNRGSKLLRLLNKEHEFILMDAVLQPKIVELILTTAWVPTADTSSLPSFLPKIPRQNLAAPRSVCLNRDINLVSASKHLLLWDGQLSESVVKFFQWDVLNINDLKLQLTTLSTTEIPKVKSFNEVDLLRETMLSLYRELSKYPLDTSTIQSLKTQRFIYIIKQTTFTSPDRVSLSVPFDLHPYIYELPEEYKDLTPFFQTFGVKTSLTHIDYTYVLESMKRKYKLRSLSEKDLHMAIDIMKSLDPSLPYSPLWIPNTHGVLVSMKDCIYNDALWIKDNSIKNYEEKHHLSMVHPEVPIPLCEQHGAKSLKGLITAGESSSNLFCPSYNSMKLEYDENPLTILLETLKIADIVKSKRVTFLLDNRNHNTESLLLPVSKFQSYALIIHMDVPLSKDDIATLLEIKEEKVISGNTYQGRGLSTYFHLGDLLTICSGSNIYFFDPIGLYINEDFDVKELANNAIGKYYPFVKSSLPTKFQDQFNPFLMFGFSPQSGPYNGTIIRIPLRVCLETDTVHVKKKSYSNEKILDFFKKWRNSISENMVFLSSVEEVSCSVWDPGNITMERLFKASLLISEESKIERAKVLFDKNWSSFHVWFTPIKYIASFYIIVEGMGKTTDSWLVSDVLGAGNSRKLSSSLFNYGIVPHGGCAALLSRKSQTTNGTLFNTVNSFISTGLPIHVNGPFILQNTTQLPKKDLRTTTSQWNYSLFENIIEAYANLMLFLKDTFGNTPEALTDFWPESNKFSEGLNDYLVPALYKKLASLQIFYKVNDKTAPILMTGGYFVPCQLSPKLTSILSRFHSIFILPHSAYVDLHNSQTNPKQLSFSMIKQFILSKSIQLNISLCIEILSLLLQLLPDNNFRELFNLPILPLGDSTIVPLGKQEFISATRNEQILLPQLRKYYVHERCVSELSDYFIKNEHFLGSLKLRRLTVKMLSSYLVDLLPKRWINTRMVQWITEPKKGFFGYSTVGILSLPQEVVLLILWKLDYEDLCRLSMTCKRLKALSEDNFIWKEKMEDYFGAFDSEVKLSTLSTGQIKSNFKTMWLRKFWEFIFNNSPNSFESSISLFREWPLIPLQNGKLCSCSYLHDIVVPFGVPVYLLNIFKEIGSPVLSTEFSQFFSSLQWAQKELPSKILQQLFSTKTIWNISLEGLSKESRIFLLEYFLKQYTHTKSDQIIMLRNLPIFKNIRGEYISIEKNQFYLVRNKQDFFQLEPDKFLAYENVDFLRYVGVQILEEADMFITFLFPQFPSLSTENRNRQCSFILEHYSSLIRNKDFEPAFKNVNFVTLADGSIVKPSEAFEQNEFFSLIFEGEPCFPVGEYSSKKWTELLKRLGLKSALTPRIIKECAEHLERISNKCDLIEFKRKSYLLIDQLNSFPITGGDCHISKTRFVLAKRLVNGKKEPVVTSFSECVLSKDCVLAWTVSPILSPKHTPNIISFFGIVSPPPLSIVVKHVSNFSDRLLENWCFSTEIDAAFLEILKYLQSEWNEMDRSSRSQIVKANLIPIYGRRLLRPCQLFLELPSHLNPFMCCVPTSFFPYVDFLKKLGLTERPSLRDYERVFDETNKEYDKVILDPNELQSWVNLLRCFLRVKENISKGIVLVPDENGVLVNAMSCYFPNCPWVMGRIQTDMVKIVNRSIDIELCEGLGIRKLSEVIQEYVAERELEFLDTNNTNRLEQILSSREFAEGVHTVLKQFSMSYEMDRRTKSLSPSVIQDLISPYKVRFVKILKTRIYFTGLSTKKDITNTAIETLSFVDKYKRIIYVAQLPPHISLSSLLARDISLILKLHIVLPIAPLLDTPPNEIRRTMRVLSLSDSSQDDYKRGVSGECLTDLDKQNIAPVTLNCKLFPKEIVAYRDNKLKTLRYGTIAGNQLACEVNSLTQSIEIDVGKEMKSVLLSDIYFFRSGKSTANTIPYPYQQIPPDPNPVENTFEAPNQKEILGSVKELLSIAGLPLDLSTENLLQEIIKLKKQLAELKDNKNNS